MKGLFKFSKTSYCKFFWKKISTKNITNCSQQVVRVNNNEYFTYVRHRISTFRELIEEKLSIILIVVHYIITNRHIVICSNKQYTNFKNNLNNLTYATDMYYAIHTQLQEF